jgi:thymidine kinase
MRGRIEVVCGPMFGGKSEELLRRLHRVELASQPYLLFKPAIDDRYSKDEVVSHAGRRKNCYLIDSAEEMLTYPLVSVVGVDEAQFIEGDLVAVCEELARRGARVILACLDTDSAGKTFGCVGDLMAVADEVLKLKAICMRCGADAGKSQRLVAAEAQVQVGGLDQYEARCRSCWTPVS